MLKSEGGMNVMIREERVHASSLILVKRYTGL